MPQRTKTPPPPQDEIFMTIFYPYPQHANMEVEEDVERVARWLGSIVEPRYFNAFYHKPSARNTVIIEVSKAIGDDKRKLLGQHIWKDILSKPSEGEKRHRSGIFYCVYASIRDVQKEGWKRIDFEDTWFMPRDGRKHTSLYYDQAEWEGIIKEDAVFNMPYPLSSRCEVPMEDPTNRGFCRPLPVDLFPIPVLPEMPREIPGTLEWTKIKALPESAWAKTKVVKGKARQQKTPQPNDQRGRTAAPRNNNVGPPVLPNHSGVSHKSPGTLPPNLVTNGKGKGKEKKTATLPLEEDELLAYTIAMSLNGEEGEDDQEYYGAGQEFNVLASAGTASSATLPPHNLVTNGQEKGKERITVMLPLEEDELLAHTVAMGLEGEEGEDDYGAGLGLDFFAPEGTASSATLPPPDLGDLIDHTGFGVYVDGVSAKPVVVEDSLWGDPLEERNKNKNKSKDNKEEDLLCDYHGKVCSRGICKVYEKQLREQRKLREAKESQNWRGGNGGPNNGRGGRGGRGVTRGTRGTILRGRGGPGRDFGPRSPRDENEAPRRTNGIIPPKNAWSKPNGNPKGNTTWGANNNTWSPSEVDGSAKPVEKSDPSTSAEDDTGDDTGPWKAPVAQGWSQSEIGSGSQVNPWSGPGKAGNQSNGKPGGAGNQSNSKPGETGNKSNGKPGETGNKPNGKPGWGETSNPKPIGRGAPLKSPVKPAWGNTGDAKDWSRSELGLEDSVSQRGGDFRNPPSMEPGKKSWADQVEDEMDFAGGDEPAPLIVPAPELEGGGNGNGSGWVQSGRGRGRGRGKGKAKSATGWSDVTAQGPW